MFNLFQSTAEHYPILFWGHLLVTVSMLGIAWRLCAKCPIALRYLRVAEWIVFAGPAFFFVIVGHAILKGSLAEGYHPASDL